MADKARAPWLSIVLAGLLASVASMIVVAAGTVAGYAFIIAFKAQGAPDPGKIEAFATRVVPFLGPAALALLVLLAAWWVVRRAKSGQLWHGVLVGVAAALPTLIFMRRPDLGDVSGLILPPLSGLVGAYLARSRVTEKRRQESA
jgi:formate hydrogenlyase subunit 3/multisubunit Na+/H+ antiporter MnhD subunit